MRYLVLAAALQQIVFPLLVNPFSQGGTHREVVRQSVPSGIEPAGYAFIIWGAIYLGALIYAIWQLTPAGRAEPVTGQIALPLIILYLGSSLWLWFAAYGPLWATVPTLALMVAMAVYALVQVSQPVEESWARWAVLVLPLALYAGWTCCAVFVNFAEVAPGYGFDRFGLARDSFAILSLALATLLALGVLWATRGEPAYAATIVWALVAIVVAVFVRGDPRSIAIASGAGIAMVLLAMWWLRSASAPQLHAI